MPEIVVTCQCGATLAASDRNPVGLAFRTQEFYRAHEVCNKKEKDEHST